MLGFNHLLAGSIVAVIVPTPLVPVVAFVSHFVLDLFPHAFGEEPPFSKKLKIQIIADAAVCVLTLIFLYWLFPIRWPTIFLGAFFGFLPDCLWIFWRRGPKWLDKFLDWAHKIQWAEVPDGWILDGFYGLSMSLILYLIAR